MTIYHNPKCSKSREGLQFIQERNENVTVRLYMNEYFTREELTNVIAKLNVKPIELVRTKEPEWIDFKNKTLTDNEILDVLLQFPKLIERPIVVKDNRAVIGRPTEKILELF